MHDEVFQRLLEVVLGELGRFQRVAGLLQRRRPPRFEQEYLLRILRGGQLFVVERVRTVSVIDSPCNIIV